MLKIRDLYKSYQVGHTTMPVLKGINLDVHQADFLAVTGSSGSGKSTLMSIMGLLDKPTRGRYWLDKKEVLHCSDDELAAMRNQKIGFVFQSFYLLQRLTAVENVGCPLRYSKVPPKEIHRRSLAMLEKWGWLIVPPIALMNYPAGSSSGSLLPALSSVNRRSCLPMNLPVPWIPM